mgnify:FL=1
MVFFYELFVKHSPSILNKCIMSDLLSAVLRTFVYTNYLIVY